MTEAAAATPEAKQFSYPDVLNLPVMPGMEGQTMTEFFEKVVPKAKALVIIAFPSGTTPSSLNPFIHDLTEKDIPVFILANNPLTPHGIREIRYETQAEAVEAGAIPLRNVNINNRLDVYIYIQEQINAGKTGKDLGATIAEKFGTPKGYSKYIKKIA